MTEARDQNVQHPGALGRGGFHDAGGEFPFIELVEIVGQRNAAHAEIVARAVFGESEPDIAVEPGLLLGAHVGERRAPWDAAKAGRLVLKGMCIG
jgi:hypothetical protein